MATILKDGSKLPLILIAKGEHIVSEDHWFGRGHNIIGEPPHSGPETIEDSYSKEKFFPSYFTDRSPKGWTNQNTFNHYLNFLRYQIPLFTGTQIQDPCNTIFMFADSYKVHHSEHSQAIANAFYKNYRNSTRNH